MKSLLLLFTLLIICPVIHAADAEITITVPVTNGAYTLPAELQNAFIYNLKYNKTNIKKATKCTLTLIVVTKNIALIQVAIASDSKITFVKTELVSNKTKP